MTKIIFCESKGENVMLDFEAIEATTKEDGERKYLMGRVHSCSKVNCDRSNCPIELMVGKEI